MFFEKISKNLFIELNRGTAERRKERNEKCTGTSSYEFLFFKTKIKIRRQKWL